VAFLSIPLHIKFSPPPKFPLEILIIILYNVAIILAMGTLELNFNIVYNLRINYIPYHNIHSIQKAFNYPPQPTGLPSSNRHFI
jgi:hypothetical protein